MVYPRLFFCLIQQDTPFPNFSPYTRNEHSPSSASVAFEDYQPVLEQAYAHIPPGCTVTLLADRGFDHKQLLQCGRPSVEVGDLPEKRCLATVSLGAVLPS
jgi:hypothetical protein